MMCVAAAILVGKTSVQMDGIKVTEPKLMLAAGNLHSNFEGEGY